MRAAMPWAPFRPHTEHRTPNVRPDCLSPAHVFHLAWKAMLTTWRLLSMRAPASMVVLNLPSALFWWQGARHAGAQRVVKVRAAQPGLERSSEVGEVEGMFHNVRLQFDPHCF